MVAYSFKKRFALPIAAGEKRQTIRGHRKRHARPGERIQLFTGMRTRHCAKIIPDPICVLVRSIEIRVMQHPAAPLLVRDAASDEDLGCAAWWRLTDGFAKLDGFKDAQDMAEFWRIEHRLGDCGESGAIFRGVLIMWAPAEMLP